MTSSIEFIIIIIYLSIGKVIFGLLWTAAMSTRSMQSHRVYAIPAEPNQKKREIKHSWHVVSDGIALFMLTFFNFIKFSPNNLLSIVITFVIFYVWVETWYYFTHRLMHKYNWLYKYHREHHLSVVVTPLSSISMSNVEKIIFYTGGWLGFMSAISWFVPVSLYGIVAYYSYHFIVSLQGHSNTEALSMNRILSTKLGMGSAASHAIHHARFNQNFGFSNLFWDKCCGTYAQDTLQMQQKALLQQGTDSIKTRLSTKVI